MAYIALDKTVPRQKHVAKSLISQKQMLHIALDKLGIRKVFFLFLIKKFIVGTH